MRTTPSSSLFSLRQTAFDRCVCDNGPDEYGNWPCDPQVVFGDKWAVCSVCGREAAWGETKGDVEVTLTTHEAVLDMVYATNESVCLRQQEDGRPGYPMVTLARQVWEDMGEPQAVTISVAPGGELSA